MIPKIIHYCWLSKTTPDSKFQKCIDTWYNHCKEYKFIHWDYSCIKKFYNENEFFRKSYNNKNYAFCSDYIRFYAVANQGGFYLDCDCQLVDSLDRLVELPSFLPLEVPKSKDPYAINGHNIECGCFGAEPSNPFVLDMLKSFDDPKVYSKNRLIVTTLANRIIRNYDYCVVEDIESAKKEDNKICLFDKPFTSIDEYKATNTPYNDYRVYRHNFFNSWKIDKIQIR